MLEQRFHIPVTAIYGSDFSVSGYLDKGFQTRFAWDTDLLSGYRAIFLSRVEEGGTDNIFKLPTRGLKSALRKLDPKAILITGYSPQFHRVALYHAFRAKLPILFRGETTDHAHERGFLLSRFRDSFLRIFYNRCASLLYIGQRSLWHFERLRCPKEKLIFSPYGIDRSSFQWNEAARVRLRPIVRKKLGIPEDKKALLFSGKLIQRKAPILFLRSLKFLPPGLREKITVIFIGSGPSQGEAKRLAQSPPRI